MYSETSRSIKAALESPAYAVLHKHLEGECCSEKGQGIPSMFKLTLVFTTCFLFAVIRTDSTAGISEYARVLKLQELKSSSSLKF